MRDIKFRGFCVNNHCYKGNLNIVTSKFSKVDEGYYISNSADVPFAYQVRPETVGQYTGLKDKNNKMIFEGDIVKAKGALFGVVVVFKDGRFVGKDKNNRIWDILKDFPLEIIGNIYEKPAFFNEAVVL